MKQGIKLRSGFDLCGSYRFIALPAMDEEATPEARIERINAYRRGEIQPIQVIETENLIVVNENHGLNLVFQHFGGEDTYPLNLNKAAIGTGTNPATIADTALQTPVLTDIERSTTTRSTSSIIFTFFMTASELANGTYREFGLYADTQLFSRSLIAGGGYAKATGMDTLVEYNINGSTS